MVFFQSTGSSSIGLRAMRISGGVGSGRYAVQINSTTPLTDESERRTFTSPTNPAKSEEPKVNAFSDSRRIFKEAIERAERSAGNAMGSMPKSQQEAVAQYRNVQALHRACTIRVERLEVTIGLEGSDPRDSYFDRSGYLTDDQTQRAYDLLMDDPSVCAKLDAIAVKLAKGELV
jgi:hypothetical protein